MTNTTRLAVASAVCALGFQLFSSAADRGGADGVRLLPMDDVAIATLPADTRDVTADAPLRSYRVGRESRPARVAKTPARLARTTMIPAGGGRFETAIAPIARAAVMTIAIEDRAPIRVEAQPGRWNVVRADLPADARSVRIVETIDAPRETLVLWGDDHLVPGTPQPGAPDVIVITLDTVRPDYLAPYAPAETTTPVLARLAQEGTRFDQAISVSSWTTPAHAALFTGNFPHPGIGFTERVEPNALTLAELFASAGYNTNGASGGPCTDSYFGFQQGFGSYLDSAESKNAAAITDWAIDRVTTSARGAPQFLFLNYFDAHELNTGVTGEEWQAADRATVRLEGAALEHLRSAYRYDIAKIDRELGRLFDAMRQSRDWNNTIVVVVGDHGQLLGERGFVGHGFTLDEELIRVPLIVKGRPADRFANRQYREQFQMTDVFPLILELAGLRPSGPGSSANNVAAGKPVRTLAFAEYHQPARPDVTSLRRWVSENLQAVRTDSFKVVRDAEGRVTTYRVGRAPQQAVVPRFDLTERLVGELTRFHLDAAMTPSGTTLTLSKDVKDRLRALGYIR
jgi:arylsulfatase A-like enzyme